MRPWLTTEFGNASSLHAEGRRAKEAIDLARERLSDALGCTFGEALFTGSGTEAANLAVVGAALEHRGGRRTRILLGAAEHHCVLETQAMAEALGYVVELVPVDRTARLDLDALASMLGEDVLLVSVMAANNELGTLNPCDAVGRMAHEAGALFHMDAVQLFGTRTDLLAWSDADLVTVSAHKIGGPKGVGAIYIRAGVKLKPLAVGGGQEREMRSGTENVAGIVGFGEAIRTVFADTDRVARKRASRDAFLDALSGSEPALSVPDREAVLPGHAHLRFPGISAESMLIRLDQMGVSASSGAACSSGSIMPSHVMMAAGYSEAESKEGLRFTFGFHSTPDDAAEAATRVAEAVASIRASKSAVR